MSVHVVIKEEDNTDTDGAESFDNELTEKQRLREIAERDPLVQQAIKAFRGEIIDVRRLDEDEE
jgi:DNA-directed RNA polymerase subunit H (RpoH/RPB5)